MRSGVPEGHRAEHLVEAGAVLCSSEMGSFRHRELNLRLQRPLLGWAVEPVGSPQAGAEARRRSREPFLGAQAGQ